MGLMFSNLDTGAANNSTFTRDVGSATKLLSSNAFVNYLQQEIYERSAMIQSGLLQQDARLNGITGVIAEMPFAAPLDYIEDGHLWSRLGQNGGVLLDSKTTSQHAYAQS